MILVAVLIAPACSTSVTYVQSEEYSAAGCSSTTLVEESLDYRAGTQIDSCNQRSVVTAQGTWFEQPPSNTWTKVTCTANTATNGYTYGRYSDSACTTIVAELFGRDRDSGENRLKQKPTDRRQKSRRTRVEPLPNKSLSIHVEGWYRYIP